MSPPSASCTLRLDCQLRQGDFELTAQGELRWHGVLGLCGPSGSGKSTLLRLLAGLEPRASGRIELDGDCLQDGRRRYSLAPHRRRIAYVFQDARLFSHLSVAGNLHYALRRARACGLGFDAVVEQLHLQPLLARGVDALSGGETQRVALGRALLSAPRLLLLDEPVSALDPQQRESVLRALESLRDNGGPPMIYVSHAPAEITRLARRTLYIANGRLALAATATLSQASDLGLCT